MCFLTLTCHKDEISRLVYMEELSLEISFLGTLGDF